MKQFLFFIKKEFTHVWRDGHTLFILLAMPLTQILIFGFALTNEVKNSSIGILDNSKDKASVELIARISASRYFDVVSIIPDNAHIDPTFKKGKIKMALIMPSDFEESLLHSNSAKIQLIADASDPNTATTLINYASAIIRDYQKELMANQDFPNTIKTEIKMLYNPQLKGSYNFVPGVIAMILMLLCSMMTSISIVKEKELGTMEVILVSPIVPLRVIFAKMIPYFIVSMINITTILLLSVFVLEVPIKGNLILLISECILFTITVLALGLLISIVAKSQQIAIFISLMGLFLPTIMLSGFMFPIENMPIGLQLISNLVPSKWFYHIIKNIMIKGSSLQHVWKETAILVGMMLVLVTVSIKKFKIRME